MFCLEKKLTYYVWKQLHNNPKEFALVLKTKDRGTAIKHALELESLGYKILVTKFECSETIIYSSEGVDNVGQC